jgi:hypothetical protein
MEGVRIYKFEDIGVKTVQEAKAVASSDLK